MRSRTTHVAAALSLTATLIAMLAANASPALAETHPSLSSFGSFTNPNGIAVDEASGDVYVADLGTDSVYKFNAAGNPVDFSSLKSNVLTGGATPAHSFSFPTETYGTPAAIAVDNSTSPSDPSAGDLYMMDAGHGMIDKFSPSGEYLSAITGFAPATGSTEDELTGLAVDTGGDVRADIAIHIGRNRAVDEFDNSSANHLIAHQLTTSGQTTVQEADGFAVGPTGDDYLLYQSCSCTWKMGQQLAELGQVDKSHAGDVAVAADPATGHLYVAGQSAITEWDTGAMNTSREINVIQFDFEAVGAQVGEAFGSLSGSSGQGGIAVNGASGVIYVSDPGEGKVELYASEGPAVSAGAASGVTKTMAVLNGTVGPRGTTVSSCRFDYGLADEFGRGQYEHTVSCQQTPTAIGAGSGPVPVSAAIEGLKPGLLYRFRLVAASAQGAGESSGLAATAGVGFGVKNFDVSFLNQDGSPDTQAGSHPFKLVNDIEFNSHYQRLESNADSPYAREPDGTLKDLFINLPPGLVGDPNATPQKCTPAELIAETSGVKNPGSEEGGCPLEAFIGTWETEDSNLIAYGSIASDFFEPIYNMVPPRGTAVQLGVHFEDPDLFINNGLLAGGDYPVQATVTNAPAAAPVFFSKVTLFGVAGSGTNRKPFLTLPTGCHGPLRSTIAIESYQEPGHLVKKEEVTRDPAGTPVSLTGCSKLVFPPTISVRPDTTDASTSSGLTVGVHVPQTAAQNPDGLAESSLRDTTVTLPEGVALNPSGGDGLESCSEGLAGFQGFSEFNPEFEPGTKTATFTPDALEGLSPGVSFCPDGSKIGTVKIKTPLLEHELEGSVYLATQNANPFGGLVAMYLMVEDPISGSTIKLTGEVHLTGTGQIITTFKNTPDLPFEDLELHFFGGERAPLATPARCGTYTTTAVFVPWDGNGPVTSTSSFRIDHGPGGGPCPGASLPFNPTLTGGTTNINAGGFSPLVTTISRGDGQQNMSQVTLHMPPGLSGLLSGVTLCPEGLANEGKCGEGSLIGETTVAAGVGSDPVSVKGGKVYITEEYHGAPFGLSIVDPVKAGPFDLEHDTSNPAYQPACDCVVVRARIEVDPSTAALTVTTNSENEGYAIPHLIDGIPVQIKAVNVTINREHFAFNPTNCAPTSITGSIASDEGSNTPVAVPFQATNCASLAFAPKFAVSTSGKTSKASGASLSVKLTYPEASFGSQANIKQVKVELPKQLPSRLTTLQKACTAAQFDTNPAGCPAASIIGHAKAITPLIPVPLEGPAYFVSNGGEAFPNLIVVLQGYGVRIDLVGDTFISKAGITSSTFKTVPDAPVGSFELTLPEGNFSALAANGNLCAPTRTVLVKKKITIRSRGHKRSLTRSVRETQPAPLSMPTEFVAQNGAQLHQSTPVSVTGCPKAKPAKKQPAKKKKKKKLEQKRAGGHR
jgi:hypothetical protein